RGGERTPAAAAEAGATWRWRDECAGFRQVADQPLGERLPVDPLGRGHDDEPRPRVNLPAAEDVRRLAQVGDGPVGAVADVDLVNRVPAGVGDGYDVAWRVGARAQRRQRRDVSS